MPTAADDALCCQGPATTLIHASWWKVAEMLVSFLRRRLGSVLLVLRRDCVVFCATEAAALTVMLLSLPLRCQQNCVDMTGIPSLVCSREKAATLIASLMWLPSRAAGPFI